MFDCEGLCEACKEAKDKAGKKKKADGMSHGSTELPSRARASKNEQIGGPMISCAAGLRANERTAERSAIEHTMP